MKALIVSDSHGLKSELEKLIEKHRDNIDFFIHCGDSELDADNQHIEKYITVRGNCDHDERLPEEIVQSIEDRTVFITHGHKYSVKSNLMKISYRARELCADIVCFGHSHQLGAEMVGGILFINPGSIKLPRGRREKTYIILEVCKNSYQIKVYDYDKGEITELAQTFPLNND